ncbi:hypothetical protein EJ02DRAFT_441875 [Clathrospora elynae]|uniref:Uncharacterized protein n=1 Tax=Clathrospora elynae TaxID=706981 RepID=A0A6A5T1F8_9PLEO|nr:hypothetical protein EJ02DRAFT_441875 [Clathrospora elynae]
MLLILENVHCNNILSLALFASISTAASHQRQGASAKQQPNDGSCAQQPKPNAATPVALPTGENGTLSQGTVTKTGGAGSNSIDGSTGAKAVPDALVVQLTLSQHVFAVNAGSNILTMLSISHQDPTSLTPLGKPAAMPGEFPNTVSALAKNKLVCVDTTEALAGISCAPFSAQGLGQFDCLRAFDLKQTAPPVGPNNTVSQTLFCAQSNKSPSSLSAKETRSSPPEIAVLFGSFVMPNDPTSLFVTDASFGAAILSLDKSNAATVKQAQLLAGQEATCWAAISPLTYSAFVTNVAMNRVLKMSIDYASILGQLDLSANGNAGRIDLKAAGDFVYALSPGTGTGKAAVTLLDISEGKGTMKEVQHFGLGGVAGGNAQGMAVKL